MTSNVNKKIAPLNNKIETVMKPFEEQKCFVGRLFFYTRHSEKVNSKKDTTDEVMSRGGGNSRCSEREIAPRKRFAILSLQYTEEDLGIGAFASTYVTLHCS